MINVSNHPSSKWSKEQLEAAGNVIDIPFPNIPPSASKEEVLCLVRETFNKIVQLSTDDWNNFVSTKVLLQGEASFCFYLTTKLLEAKFDVVVATSERNVVENILSDGSTKKDIVFKFVQFRSI